jgi:hypothetical protein
MVLLGVLICRNDSRGNLLRARNAINASSSTGAHWIALDEVGGSGAKLTDRYHEVVVAAGYVSGRFGCTGTAYG